jgi:hypothetical protein
MMRAVFGCLCSLLTFFLGTFGVPSAQTVQPRSIYSGPPPKQAISIDSLIPPNSQISPMPLTERIRLAAVPNRGMCSAVPADRADNALISGNGNMWVEVYGDPHAEQIISTRRAFSSRGKVIPSRPRKSPLCFLRFGD